MKIASSSGRRRIRNKVDVVAINVNNSEADKLPKMSERAKEKGFNFPYLYDETQTIARTSAPPSRRTSSF